VDHDCVEVGELILEISDRKNDYTGMAVEKTVEEVLYQPTVRR